MSETTYDLNDVVQKMAIEIANLNVSLAHERTAKEAYMRRAQELESEMTEPETTDAEIVG